MEKKYDRRFKVMFDTLKRLMEPAPERRKRPIGFVGRARSTERCTAEH
jgi:phosphoenolpyruvate carboxylase